MATRYKAELGQAIRRRRDELGLTQKDLAEAAHYKEAQTVSRWERGETAPTDLEAVAAALGWTLAEMMAGIEPPNRRTARRMGLDGTTPDPFAGLSQLDRIERLLIRLDSRLEELVGGEGIEKRLIRVFERELSPRGSEAGSRRSEGADGPSATTRDPQSAA